jgi:hypothetical protein
MAAENGAKFTDLWYGDRSSYTNPSAADMAFCNFLAFYTGKDASRMDQLFRQSGLMRDKWDRDARTGEKYGEGTIRKAIEDRGNDTYDPLYYQKKRDAERESELGKIMNSLDEHEANQIEKDISEDSTQNTEPLEDQNTKEQPQTNLLKERVDRAIKAKSHIDLYKLAEGIALLPELDRLIIMSDIREGMEKHKAFQWAEFKKRVFQAQMNIAEEEQQKREEQRKEEPQYKRLDNQGMFVNDIKEGYVEISNFTAEIIADVKIDDGAEETRSYEIEAELSGRSFHFEVPVEDFEDCKWKDRHLPARAYITVGSRMRDHFCNAIRTCSNPEKKCHYGHTGWRKINGTWVYLHNGGVLSGVSGEGSEEINYPTHSFFSSASAYRATLDNNKSSLSGVSGVSGVDIEASVKLTGPLSNYVFSSERDNLQQAIQASLKFMDLTKDTITMPLFAAVWRSVLGESNFGVHLAGQTGQGKSQLAALAQQFFGASMNADYLPGTWESTENALEMQLFQIKDAIFCADDFKPKGSKNDQDRIHSKADRVYRSIGNRSARGRLNSDLQLRAQRVPRCLLLSTGEDIPRGQSCQARMVVLVMTESVTKGNASKRLYLAQEDAGSGLYAQAMAGYIEWIAPRIESIQSNLRQLVAGERDRLSSEGHSRAGTNTANLILGMKCFLQYACEISAITPQEAQVYLTRCITALVEVASEASREDHQMKPSEQWIRLLISAISGKRAHLVTVDGKNPGLEYGWKESTTTGYREGESYEQEHTQGGGMQIGWIVDNDIYLNPTLAYTAVVEEGSRSHDYVTTTQVMLNKALFENKIFASTDMEKEDPKRRRYTIRKRLQGHQPDVLHIKKEILFSNDPLSDSPHSPHFSHSEAHQSASEEGSGVSGVNYPENSEGGKSSHSESSQPRSGSIPVEYQELFVRYEAFSQDLELKGEKVRAYSSKEEQGYTLVDVDSHCTKVKRLLNSGQQEHIQTAIRAMQFAMEVAQ